MRRGMSATKVTKGTQGSPRMCSKGENEGPRQACFRAHLDEIERDKLVIRDFRVLASDEAQVHFCFYQK